MQTSLFRTTQVRTRSATATASLCVLGSGSGGNCSVLSVQNDSGRRMITLIDLGLGLRRTTRQLHELGIEWHEVHDVLLTHMDQDHFKPGWIQKLPKHVRVHLPKAHRGRASRAGLMHRTCNLFTEDGFDLSEWVGVWPMMMSHDSLGVAAFRLSINTGDGERSMGFATDLGRVTEPLIDHLSGVDTLAIESNYCPRLQLASDRPHFLKQRIMGGSGHLSNEESHAAIQQMQPRDHVVLLHLSRQCNDPVRVAALHEGSPYRVTRSHARIAPATGCEFNRGVIGQ